MDIVISFHCLTGGRWTWLAAETCLQRRGSEASRSAPRASRERLRKRLVHHKQQMVNLETATKSLGEVGSGVSVSLGMIMINNSNYSPKSFSAFIVDI